MDASQEVKEGETAVVSEKEPMIVWKNQEDLRERMDSHFWDPKYILLLDTIRKNVDVAQLSSAIQEQTLIFPVEEKMAKKEDIFKLTVTDTFGKKIKVKGSYPIR